MMPTAAGLLILDARHPRSVRFNLSALQRALQSIGGAAPGDDIIAGGLGDFLVRLHRHCRAIGEHNALSYFDCAAPSLDRLR